MDDEVLPRPRWLLSENRRTLIATLAACILSAGTISLLVVSWRSMRTLLDQDQIGYLLLCCVVVWATLAVLQGGLTWIAYRGLTGDRFERAITADPDWQRRRARAGRPGVLRVLSGGPLT